MRVAFDSSSDEEEPLFNMEDIDRKAFENDKELPLLTQFLNALKKLGEDRNSLKSTICYCGVFMVFGMSDEILGPTLLELKCLTGKSITVMSVLFFVHDLCNVFGSTSGGYLVDRFNPNVLVTIALALSAMCIIAIPLSRIFVILLLLAGIFGGCFGATDTFTTVSPYLQALHFSYGVGGFVSPLVAQPFLRRRCVLVVNYTTIIDEWPYANSTSGIDNSTHIFHSQEEMQRDTHVRWAYWIVALMHVFGDDQKPRVVLVTVLTSLILLLYDGLMATFGAYVYSYAVKGAVHIKPSHAAYLNSLFWGSLSVGRFVSIPVAMYVKPPTMLMINLSEAALWLGTSGAGLFMSSVFPTSIALAEYYIDLTAPVTSVMIVSAALGELILPLVVGQVFERLGPVSFLAIAFCACFMALMIFILLRSAEKSDTDWLGFFWFVWCGNPPNSANQPTSQNTNVDSNPTVETGGSPPIDTVELNIQG
ncbi:Sodium-dependent glucose transporter 1 [Acropora cervicornis]|uniref:Sodium-dependent glucose transporter 1 n=1 Tax=Acropora cervicornis TaxID=6130 RepID=A0AAD9R1M9_ACRCE|nr:Sodium-dependent glucose transporter 1 [Acropora cervicornis]